jgi:putative addiction module CopG family antidote
VICRSATVQRNLTLDRRWAEFIEEQVELGFYNNGSEVLKEALRNLMREQIVMREVAAELGALGYDAMLNESRIAVEPVPRIFAEAFPGAAQPAERRPRGAMSKNIRFSLTRALNDYVDEQVHIGNFNSSSAVVQTALKRLSAVTLGGGFLLRSALRMDAMSLTAHGGGIGAKRRDEG